MTIIRATLLSLSFLLLFIDFGLAQTQSKESPLTAQGRLVPFEVEAGQIAQVEVDLQLPKGFRAYEDQFKLKILSPEGIQLSKFNLQPVQEIFDKFSKKKKNVMLEKAQMRAALEVSGISSPGSQKMVLEITYQACTDAYCLFPKTITTDVFFKAKGAVQEDRGLFQLSFRDAYKKGAIWAFLFVFIFGFLTSFTPCVYPMVPITLAVLGREAHARSRWQSFLVSVMYVLGIAFTFSLLGILAASTGALFGSFMSSPWILGFVCLVFFVMSLSMFGLFELQAPQFLRDGVLSHMQLHGYLGAFITGLLAGLIASPCVGPVLVGVLTFVAQTQNLWLGFWLLFTYAIGMGLIFLALGLSTNLTKLLPKSGAWMNRIKIFFGVLLLGASIYYLDILLVSSKAIEKSFISSALSARKDSGKGFKVDTINWQTYSEDVLAQAKAEGKPVIIDFWADWCAACLEMNEKTFPDQGLQLLSGQFVMVKFNATQDSPELETLKKRYGLIGLPTFIFISKSGDWIQDLTLTEFEEASKFRERMTKALSK
ncbi:MAG: cytochrome c biogenesis protein CcdA [Pseudobdellovibrionaceae bacterium]